MPDIPWSAVGRCLVELIKNLLKVLQLAKSIQVHGETTELGSCHVICASPSLHQCNDGDMTTETPTRSAGFLMCIYIEEECFCGTINTQSVISLRDCPQSLFSRLGTTNALMKANCSTFGCWAQEPNLLPGSWVDIFGRIHSPEDSIFLR